MKTTLIHRLTDAEIEPYVARLESADGVDPASLPSTACPCHQRQHRPRAHPHHRRLPRIRLHAWRERPSSCSNSSRPAPCHWARPTSTSSPPASTAPARLYGACRNAFNPEFVSGGSSSGSAVSVAKGYLQLRWAPTPPASGRARQLQQPHRPQAHHRPARPPAWCRPAARSTPCPSSRSPPPTPRPCWPWPRCPTKPTPSAAPPNPSATSAGLFASACRARKTNFFGNDAAIELFASIARLGITWAAPPSRSTHPLLEAARLLYEGPAAERYVAIKDFIDAQPEAVFPPVRTIIEGGKAKTAADAFAAS
ncbi:MAG: hypothetical protein R3E56_00045 [Burkholderiaceae bacterium]